MKKFAKPYPNDEFIRRFYYYNSVWNNYKEVIRHNIKADAVNKNMISHNKMRKKFVEIRDEKSVKLPQIFMTKKMGGQKKV
jgi:hypothetical protein